MTIVIIALFIVGLFLIVLEAVVPFGLAAIAGFIAIGFSIFLAFTNFSLTLAIFYCFIALIVALIVVRYSIRFGLDALALSPPAAKQSATLTTQSRMDAHPDLGTIAKVIQPLRPTGTIEWEGRRLAARTLHPERVTPIGASVRVAGKDSTFWLVEDAPAPTSDSPSASAPQSTSPPPP